MTDQDCVIVLLFISRALSVHFSYTNDLTPKKRGGRLFRCLAVLFSVF
jgi:hypothetical protein